MYNLLEEIVHYAVDYKFAYQSSSTVFHFKCKFCGSFRISLHLGFYSDDSVDDVAAPPQAIIVSISGALGLHWIL